MENRFFFRRQVQEDTLLTAQILMEIIGLLILLIIIHIEQLDSTSIPALSCLKDIIVLLGYLSVLYGIKNNKQIQ